VTVITTTERKMIKAKVGLLELAKQLGSVTQACWVVGYSRASTIVTSQVPVDHWHEHIGNPTIAAAVLDRLVHGAQRGSTSLRVIPVWLDRWDGECAGGP
jgi:hypothetical protein